MESLAKRILNNPGLAYLALDCEKDEIRALEPPTVRLKRTYNQDDGMGSSMRFWRVVGPASHPNYGSDLSLEGLKEWGIL